MKKNSSGQKKGTSQIVLAMFLLSAFICKGQITFQKTFGGIQFDEGYDLQLTKDSGYVISGISFKNGKGKACLIKTNANGDTLWTRVCGGPGVLGERSTSVIQTSDGGFVLAGNYDNAADSAKSDIYLIKTNLQGDTLWTKTYGSPDAEQGISVQQTNDNGLIVSGVTRGLGAGNQDLYVLKTDSSGSILWTKTFGGSNEEGGEQTGHCVQQTADNGYIITGSTKSFGAGDWDFYLVKTDSTGDTLWTKTFGGNDMEMANSVLQTQDGGYLVAGHSMGFGAGGYDVYVVRTDGSGNLLWSKTYGGTSDETATGIEQTNDGGFIISAWTGSFGTAVYNAWLIKINNIGDTVWTKTYGGTSSVYGDAAYAVHQAADGGFIFAGDYDSGSGTPDILLVKTSADGSTACNFAAASPVVTSPATIVSSTNTQISSGGMINPSISLFYNGSTVTELCSTTAFENTSAEIKNSPDVYPNPFRTQTIISAGYDLTGAEIKIYTITGQEIKNIKGNPGKTITLDRGDLPAGIYFFKLVLNNNDLILPGKFIAE